MSRTVDPDSLGFVITDVGRLLRAAVEKRIVLNGTDITPGEARALIHIAALNGGRQTVLAERLGVEPMTVSGYVDRLEQRGLVERRVDSSDRRARLVYATDAADQVIDEARAVAGSVLGAAMEGVAPADKAVFEAVLRSMRGSLQSMLGCDRSTSGQAA
jgi:MarR family transcriptional regulator, transcriptional regulator for hemolysin